MDRFVWTHPTTTHPVDPAQVAAYGPSAAYPPAYVHPPVPAELAAYSARVTKSKRRTSHAFHLIMTIITCGLWAPVWIWMTWQNILIKEKTVTRYSR